MVVFTERISSKPPRLSHRVEIGLYADVAELADALDSGSSESNFIWVQVPSSAPTKADPNLFGSALVYVDIKT